MAFYSQNKKALIALFVIILAVGVAALWFGSQQPKNTDIRSQAVVDMFQNELVARGVERVGQPIEGFDAMLLLQAFPGLEEEDFDDVETFEGIYTYRRDELIFERTQEQPISSAERTVSTEGYATLLDNVANRLDIRVHDEQTVREVITTLAAVATTPQTPSDITEHIASKSDLIVVDEPEPMTVITSPLTVRGQARGTWYFEGDFPIMLTDWDGRIIAEWYASAVLDPNDPESTWMTEDFVPFEGTLEFDNPSWDAEFSRRGTLIFQKDNPSDLPEHDDALEIPVLFEMQQAAEQPGDEPVIACPDDGKICPDGSFVGRVGPNCEFAACPGEDTQ